MSPELQHLHEVLAALTEKWRDLGLPVEDRLNAKLRAGRIRRALMPDLLALAKAVEERFGVSREQPFGAEDADPVAGTIGITEASFNLRARIREELRLGRDIYEERS